MTATSSKFVAYLAVLPFYRREMLRVLSESSVPVSFFAGDHHIDRSVKTDVPRECYTRVLNLRPFGRFLVQIGHWREVLSSDAAILDLNPRSISTWVLLLARKGMRRRSLVWGHLYPRAGAASRTAGVRRLMRRLASGTVLYTYDSAAQAKSELPDQPVWVAPNALYRSRDISASIGGRRALALYVGRLVVEKNVRILLDAFATPALSNSPIRLVLVGDGVDRPFLESRARELGIARRVVFKGAITGVAELSALYSRAVCSLSPGYAGLSVTQSLGFGVPIIVSKDQPHAPEIELARYGGVTYFDTGSIDSLVTRILGCSAKAGVLPLQGVSASVRTHYSAEAMARGISDALMGVNEWIGGDGGEEDALIE